MNRALVSVSLAAALLLAACSRGGGGPGRDVADLAMPIPDGNSDDGGGSAGDGGAVDAAAGMKDLRLFANESM